METIKSLIAITALTLFASCTNNNHNTGGMDSASVSTDASMQGINNTNSDSGMTSSDSTDIRKPMADTTGVSGNPDSIRR